jgi:chromatin modification-related protein VID21
MLIRSSAIVTSRKRKLRELFAVATHAESLPRDGFTNPNATEPAPAESLFLQANDILQ